MGDYPSVSQVMKKTIPYNYSVFRIFAEIACLFLQVIPSAVCILFFPKMLLL
jgi:hypothetical protein